ncbi:hypothetical protein [Anaeromyxobacter oryzae]|uniref:Phosphate-selective porin O and P n=1 Tax=Anaeromyxobacter oryzae TaxID=2918170 RepID=A0ABM7WZR4_9BACT|nr:hypothetical protein [Anaeromyxobacter oryzae]BDG05034.1 hypothetical protein AMOR_40300 [Anaeromyxobacter oryzae]
MRGLVITIAASAALALIPGGPRAGDDEDLGRIPGEALAEEAPPQGTQGEPPAAEARTPFERRLFLEGAATASPFTRSVPVPYPNGVVVPYQNRTSLDGALTFSPVKPLRFVLSDRLNVLEASDLSFFSSQTVENDLREAFVSAEIHRNTFLEVGRVNERNGIALGFNPTDFLKTRTLVGQSSLDPSVIRENRLGVLMVRLESVFPGGGASLAFAPKVRAPSPLSEHHPLGVDPRFGATNGMNRAVGTVSLDLLDLSPELIGYLEPHRQKIGLNVSHGLGSAVVLYGEWAGGRERNLAARAHDLGVATGTLPPSAPVLPPTTTSTAFLNDLAAGFSLTVGTTATLNLEYHLHEGGLGGSAFRRWLSAGSSPSAPSFASDELWYVRGYAADLQEPLARQELFFRVSFPKTLRHDLDLGAFAFVNLADGSSLSQLSLSYYLSDAWTVSAYLSANLGARDSERGSEPASASGILSIKLYL